MLTLWLTAAVLAALATWIHPPRLEPTPSPVAEGSVSLAALRAGTGPILWIDARPGDETDGLPGAIHMEAAQWEEGMQQVLEAWSEGMRIVVYAEPSQLPDARYVASRLKRETEFAPIHLLADDWRAAAGAEAFP